MNFHSNKNCSFIHLSHGWDIIFRLTLKYKSVFLIYNGRETVNKQKELNNII